MIQLVDTHCHLVSEQLSEQSEQLIKRALDTGVTKIINIAYDPKTVELAIQQSLLYPSVYAAVGIQPHDSHTYDIHIAEHIKNIAHSNTKVVGIGEIGLDYFHKDCTKEQQLPCFDHFLDIGLATQLPVIIHVRNSFDDVYKRLSHFSKRGGRGVIHCFTGSIAEAEKFLDLDFFISFSGIVTFKNAADIQDVARYVPLDKLVIETDSPYLAPVPQRGKVNEPSWVLHVCQKIADLKGIPWQEVAAATTNNAHSLFKRL